MGSLARIRARRAAVLGTIASARMRIAARRRMVELEVELARVRHPSTRLARHLPSLVALGVTLIAGSRRRGPAGLPAGSPVRGAIVSVLAALVPLLLRRAGSR